ncbi:class I SAM-dependent methyltransferase [Cognatishimia sp.]|uniref:class I SAM-dependent DNA methyltransferase n=1 Tax=Cognatishimia sp. TaxID=2211648 RepID=UPI0035148E53
MTKDQAPNLGAAYALRTPDDSRRLYADWASSYDRDFVAGSGYILHGQVARVFADQGGQGPVLDVGAGTGVLGQVLAQHGVTPIDATDISQDMLDQAQAKSVYRRLFTGDLTERLPVPDGTYCGVVSSGTFTHGHVGPDALDELLRITAAGGILCLSINAEHYEAQGFAEKLDGLASQISDLQLPQLPIYGPENTSDHRHDLAVIATFRKT